MSDGPQRYPLSWPIGKPRTYRRRRSNFSTGFAGALNGLLRELKLLSARSVVISTNVPLRRDGLPYAGMAQPPDPGVAVYWRVGYGDKEQRRVMAIDRFDRVEDNLHAIEKSIEAIRGLARWGGEDIMEQAYAGFAALPPIGGTSTTARPWRAILGFEEINHWLTTNDVEDRFRALALERHPDRGGSEAAMSELNAARMDALHEIQERR